jgi:CrcB protein
LRYLADVAVQRRHDTRSEITTAVDRRDHAEQERAHDVHRQRAPREHAVVAGLGVGFCGALTTYSTFGYETLRLIDGGARFYALANVGISVAAGLGAVSIGWTLGAALA